MINHIIMLSTKNNFCLSSNFEHINKYIFEFKVINLVIGSNTLKIVYRKKKNSSKLNFLFSKSGLVSEFRGFLEIWGTCSTSIDNLKHILVEVEKLIKIYNPGLIIFRNFYVKEIESSYINEYFYNYNYDYRNWKTKILDIENYASTNFSKRFHKKIKKDILKISSIEPEIIEVNNQENFNLYLKLFFKSEGHKDYPEQKNMFKQATWELYKKHHKFFILKKNNEYLGVFGVRIYNNLASLVMIGRNKLLKNSIHSFLINYLIEILANKKIKYLDLTGFNPFAYSSKEKGIKFFKQRFDGKEILIPTYVKDNTYINYYLRKLFNFFFKRNKLADENWII